MYTRKNSNNLFFYFLQYFLGIFKKYKKLSELLEKEERDVEEEEETLDAKTAKEIFEMVSKRINKQKRRSPSAKKARIHSNEESSSSANSQITDSSSSESENSGNDIGIYTFDKDFLLYFKVNPFFDFFSSFLFI